MALTDSPPCYGRPEVWTDGPSPPDTPALTLDEATAMGRGPDVRTTWIQGSLAAAIAAPEMADLWGNGTTDLVYPTSGGVLTVTSTLAADADGLAGINTAVVVYLAEVDGEWILSRGTVALQGTANAPVLDADGAPITNAIRVLEVVGVPGSNGGAVGVVTAEIAENPQIFVRAGDNTSDDAHFTVPDRYVAYVSGVQMSGDSTTNEHVVLFQQRPPGGGWQTAFKVLAPSPQPFTSVPPFGPFLPKTDVRIRAQAVGGAPFNAAIGGLLFKIVPAEMRS